MFIMSTPIQKMAEAEYTEGHAAFFILRSTVEDCIHHGYLPPADPDTAAYAMWSFVHGNVSLMIRKRMTMIPEEKYPDLLEDSLNFLMNAILPKHQRTEAIMPLAVKKSRIKS
jgi:hypothetical protein